MRDSGKESYLCGAVSQKSPILVWIFCSVARAKRPFSRFPEKGRPHDSLLQSEIMLFRFIHIENVHLHMFKIYQFILICICIWICIFIIFTDSCT